MRAARRPSQAVPCARKVRREDVRLGRAAHVVLHLDRVVVQLRVEVERKLGEGRGRLDQEVGAREQQGLDQRVLALFVIVGQAAVRKRVEAMANSEGRSDIDLSFYQSAKQAMAPS